jgi:hypothetical protein
MARARRQRLRDRRIIAAIHCPRRSRPGPRQVRRP